MNVNGKQTVQVDAAGRLERRPRGSGTQITGPGTIALQGHDPNSTVYYKNIRIKPLGDQQAPAPTPAPTPAPATPGGRGGQAAQAPAFTSPEILPDRRIAFRLYAPEATSVALRGGDIPRGARGRKFTKGPNGVWEMTTGAVEPGAYRYVFIVNGVGVIDPRNTAISESNATTWSVATVPGSDVMDTKSVPHGAVATVYYSPPRWDDAAHARLHAAGI